MASDACPICEAPDPRTFPIAVYAARSLALLECRRCGFIFASTRLDDQVRHASAYHRVREECRDPALATVDAAGFIAYWAAKLGWSENVALLDVGCAEGRLVEVARCMGYRADGIDVSDYYVDQWARSAVSAQVATAEEYRAGHEAVYNAVIARQVIEHVRDPVSFLRACAGMLSRGGACLIETGDPSSWQARLQGGAWNFWVPREGVGSHISFINSRAAEVLGRRSELTLRDSVPQLRYTSLQSYARGHRQAKVGLRLLVKFFLHQSRLSAARCYWYERPDSVTTHSFV